MELLWLFWVWNQMIFASVCIWNDIIWLKCHIHIVPEPSAVDWQTTRNFKEEYGLATWLPVYWVVWGFKLSLHLVRKLLPEKLYLFFWGRGGFWSQAAYHKIWILAFRKLHTNSIKKAIFKQISIQVLHKHFRGRGIWGNVYCAHLKGGPKKA